MKKATYMSDLHFEHKAWASELSFQKEELDIFQKRLGEVVPKYTDKDVLREVEQLQNKLMVHNEVLDTLLHEINVQEQSLASFAKSHPVASDHVHFKDHTAFRDKVETQGKMYSDFKKGFMRFLTETM